MTIAFNFYGKARPAYHILRYYGADMSLTALFKVMSLFLRILSFGTIKNDGINPVTEYNRQESVRRISYVHHCGRRRAHQNERVAFRLAAGMIKIVFKVFASFTSGLHSTNMRKFE